MSAPSTMELCAGTEERLMECADCARDFRPDLMEEVKRRTPQDKWYWESLCPGCLAKDAAKLAEGEDDMEHARRLA